MAEPEIARRCSSCGASIRVAAFFCPQCGNALPRRDSREVQPPVTPKAEETVPKSAAAVSDSAVEPGMEARRDAPADLRDKSQKETRQRPQTKEALKAPDTEAARTSVGQAALGAVGARIHRATTMARDVEGDVIQRVQKVREMSSVVLDEAGGDPSLRFVLVAAVLFLLFLIIVLLNRFIT
jgi:hypothetical protein